MNNRTMIPCFGPVLEIENENPVPGLFRFVVEITPLARSVPGSRLRIVSILRVARDTPGALPNFLGSPL
jgi:hypothetical protein